MLFVYGGRIQPLELRGQFLRVTTDGLQPIPREAVPAGGEVKNG